MLCICGQFYHSIKLSIILSIVFINRTHVLVPQIIWSILLNNKRILCINTEEYGTISLNGRIIYTEVYFLYCRKVERIRNFHRRFFFCGARTFILRLVNTRRQQNSKAKSQTSLPKNTTIINHN